MDYVLGLEVQLREMVTLARSNKLCHDCQMSEQRSLAGIRRRARFGRRIVLRARSWLAVPAIILGLLGYWRDEGPTGAQPPLISNIVGLLPWWGWIMVALALLLLIAFEGSYRIVADVDPEFASGEPQSISLEEMGLLDYVPEHVRATRMFTRRLRRLTRKQSQATRLMNLHSGRMQNTADANQKQRIAIQVAKIIDGQNDELTQALPILREQSTRFTSALQGFVTSSEIQTPADLEALQTLRASTVLFVANLNGSHRAVTGWRAATVGLRGRNVSAAINRACDTMERLLGDYVALYLQIESSEGGILKAMDRRLLEAPSG